ncbi:MAG: FecR family protein [Chloroflexota bacterium]
MTTAAVRERDMENIAWTVLLAAFVVFLLLLVGLPALGYWYLYTATDPHESTLTVLSGTVIVDVPGRDATGERGTRMVPEGSTIRTDANTRVNLGLFDGSTVTILPESQVTLAQMQTPRFALNPALRQARLDVHSGRVRLDIAPSDIPRGFAVTTPHGEAQFQPGYYTVEATSAQADVSASDGGVVLRTRSGELAVSGPGRARLKNGEPPHGPLPPKRDLVIGDRWIPYNDQGSDGGKQDGAVLFETVGNRPVAHFVRQNSGGDHAETGIKQIINQDVADADSLLLHFDVLLKNQSLSGGGFKSSEFPLMVRVDYRDVRGGETFWVHGFYYQNDGSYAIYNGEHIPQGQWYPYETRELAGLNTKIARIISIQIFGSGWDFDSAVSDAQLIVE